MRITDHTLDVPKFEGDVTNKQAVGRLGDDIVILAPTSAEMTREQSLIHAAWLVALADESENCEEFRRILRAVLET